MDANKASLRGSLTRGFERHRKRHFLDAAMAATALVSMADEEERLSEQLALDFVLERVEELNLFDPHKAVDLHRRFANAIRDYRESGEAKAFSALSRFAGDSAVGSLLVRISLAIARADSECSAPERRMISEICTALKVSESEFVRPQPAR